MIYEIGINMPNHLVYRIDAENAAAAVKQAEARAMAGDRPPSEVTNFPQVESITTTGDTPVIDIVDDRAQIDGVDIAAGSNFATLIDLADAVLNQGTRP